MAKRTNLAAALLAASATILVTGPGILSPWFAVSIALSLSGGALGYAKPQSRVITLSVGVIAVSALLAIPSTVLFGSDHLPQTMVMAMIVVPYLGFYFASAETKAALWRFLAPVMLAHAGMVLWDASQDWALRATGLAGSPTVAGGVLVLGILWFMPIAKAGPSLRPLPTWLSSSSEALASHGQLLSHRWLLALPLLAALVFTQSRLAIVVVGSVIVVKAVCELTASSKQKVFFSVFAVAVLGAGATVAADRFDPPKVINDVAARLPIVRIPRLWPVGHLDDSDLSGYETPRVETMHNVPIKLAMELGVGAGLAWVLATVLGLCRSSPMPKGPPDDQNEGKSEPGTFKNHPPHFWLLLAVALLSMLDFYPMTVMGWAWFALVGHIPRSPIVRAKS
jgi:hypothetical protein